MNAFKTLLVPAILLVAAASASACDSYGCYDYSYSYYPSYSYSYNNYDYSTPFHSCYYSSWTYSQPQNYYYCYCYYRASQYAPWSKYVCIYNRDYSNYTYFYNPSTQQYWGRFDQQAKGFSVLPEGDRKGAIADLPQDKFPTPVAQIGLPGSQVKEQIVTPPAPPADAVAALPAS
jgi:hypothetical protein